MRLLLLRHAIAEDLVSNDFDRRLTVEGRARCRRVLRHYVRVFEPPSIIFSSPLVRARQTGRIAARLFGVPLRRCDALQPDGDAYGWLCEQPCEHLMLVGHEPDLANLAARFLGVSRPIFSFKKAGMAWLEGKPGAGEVRWLITPRWLVSQGN